MTRTGKDSTTIVAVATPRGAGGLGIVRLSGSNALCIAQEIFRGSEALGAPRLVQYGRFLDARHQPIDTGLAWYLPGPKTYTGEDTVELSAHGSELVLRLVVQAAIAHGATAAEPGEFTRRAFVNNRLDLLQAESVLDLIHAGSRHEVLANFAVASGRLSAEVRVMRQEVLAAIVQVEADLDFGEEDLDVASAGSVLAALQQTRGRIRGLIEGFDGAQRRRDGWMVLLAGPPNAGKSTLLNALSHEDRSIVAPTPGTTRDWVDVRVEWEGELIRLVDTAGLRRSNEVVEQEGVRRTEALIDEADVVVFVVDESRHWPAELEASPLLEAAAIIVRSKGDLVSQLVVPEEVVAGRTVWSVSAMTGAGLNELQRGLLGALPRGTGNEVGILRERHREHLTGALAALTRAMEVMEIEPEKAAADLHEALGHAGTLLGEDVSEAVLDAIFREFCIGK